MQNSLETFAEKLVFVLGIPVAVAMIFGITLLGAVCHHHCCGAPCKGMFESCGKRLSETIIELETPGGSIYIVDGVWVDITGRYGGI